MKEKRASNYEKLCEDWRLKFLELDQEKLCRKLPELKPEGEYLTLFHFGQKYGVHRQNGQIVALSDLFAGAKKVKNTAKSEKTESVAWNAEDTVKSKGLKSIAWNGKDSVKPEGPKSVAWDGKDSVKPEEPESVAWDAEDTVKPEEAEYGQSTEIASCPDTVATEMPEAVSVNVRLDIYNLFWYSKETACFQNRWVPFRELRNAGPFAPAFEKNILKPLAATFEGKPDKLREAALALGAEILPQADVGFVLPCFSCIPIQFLFWDGDDEFPAQANILFDYSATDYIHVESTVTLATEGLLRLKKAAGLPLRGTTFEMEQMAHNQTNPGNLT